MSSPTNSGEAEFPFDKQTVFAALLRAIPKVEGMKVDSSDALSGRVTAKAGMSLMSWGENIPITLSEPGSNRTLVRIASTAKTGFSSGGFMSDDGLFASGDMTFGKHRKNVERIFSALSAELSKLPSPAQEPAKKKCPFCAELIQTEAIKCRFCGSDLRKAEAPNPEAKAEVAPVSEPTPAEEELNARVIGEEVHFECSLCRQPLAISVEAAGQEFRCPECGEHLVVPTV